ncbi:hypothetical protein [Nocardia sp. BMG51109]|uniref:hypothetical protein n=1 Tax=Nocardia sp. BMG51109 TaxID=1056816 RepID=UPI0012EC214E|nr:hypothetical protein [Nocardia sp. BMG51109]
MTTCTHPACLEERPEERLGKAAVAALLGDHELDRVCQNERPGPVVDYRSARTAVEVKALKNGELEKLRAAIDKQPNPSRPIGVPGLKETWFVLPDASAAVGERSEYAGTPSVREIETRLGPLLLELERQGIDDAFTAPWELRHQISSILHGGACSVFPTSRLAPGILLAGHQYGHSCSFDIDSAVRDKIQGWVDTGSGNMVESFDGESAQHCGVLVIPQSGAGFSIGRSLSEDFGDFAVVSTKPLSLPVGMDILVTVAGDQVLAFTPPAQWRRISLERGDCPRFG